MRGVTWGAVLSVCPLAMGCVTYRAPGDSADRIWPLSHLPLIIDDADWRQLTAGIVQRATLLELVLRDLYGEGRLVKEGAIPAAAIAGSTEYLRAVSGVKPPGGRYLHIYAADIGSIKSRNFEWPQSNSLAASVIWPYQPCSRR